MRDLTEALELIADGAAQRAELSPDTLEAAAAEGARRRRGTVLRAIGAVAGVAAAGVLAVSLLGGPGRGTPPVGPDPSPTRSPSTSATSSAAHTWPPAVTATAVPACGDPAPAIEVPEGVGLRLRIQTPTPEGSAVLPADQRVAFRVTVDDAPTGGGQTTSVLWAAVPEPASLVLVARTGPRAGQVVSVQTVPDPPTGPQMLGGMEYLWPAMVAFTACDEPQAGERLPDGDYDAYAYLPLAGTLAQGRWSGGDDPLLLVSDPVTITLGGEWTAGPPAPALPTCGESTAGLAPSTDGLFDADTSAPADGGGGLSVLLGARTAPDQAVEITWRSIEWVAEREGRAVAAGTFAVDPEDHGLAGTIVWALPTTLVQVAPLVECSTGAPLAGGGPVTFWTRPTFTADLTPLVTGDADATISVIATPAWFTYQPQPVPSLVPVLGAGQPARPEVLQETVVQTEARTWEVNQSWAGHESYDTLRDALVAAGFTVSELPVHPDEVPAEMARARFDRPDGVRIEVVHNTVSGDGTFAGTWTITVP